jgi:hypothetical protein
MWDKSITRNCMKSTSFETSEGTAGTLGVWYVNCRMLYTRLYNAPSSFSLPIMSSTLPTLTPPCLAGGSVTLTVSSLGFMSTPKSSGVIFSNGFFFAFMIFGNEA